MTLKAIPALAFVVMVSLSAGQVEHAPTAAQCQADQRLWLSKVEAGEGQAALPEYGVIGKWAYEMSDCMNVDPENKLRYYNTESEIYVEQKGRLRDFIQRHQMWNQFLDEDEGGKR
jgi:hypothetical protein